LSIVWVYNRKANKAINANDTQQGMSLR